MFPDVTEFSHSADLSHDARAEKQHMMIEWKV